LIDYLVLHESFGKTIFGFTGYYLHALIRLPKS